MVRPRSIEVQLPDYIRTVLLERHTFFVREAKKRLLNQFEDIEGEADRHQEEVWEAAMNPPFYGDEPDMGDIAQAVTDEAAAHYMLLDEMRKQVRLSMIAAMFHQWDKELREFLEAELRHYIEEKWIRKHVWNAKTVDLFDLFEELGWRVKSMPLYSLIDACNLVVNVYKHGKGSALTRLHHDFPQYMSKLGTESWIGTIYLDHRWLEVTDRDFDEFASAFETFWREIPDSLIYHFPEEPT